MKYKWKDAELYTKLYKEKPEYGSTGLGKYTLIIKYVDDYSIKSIFDFGCGTNYVLLKKIGEQSKGLSLRGYDPAILDSQINETVSNQISTDYKSDMIVSTDCLEHIPENELDQCWKIFKNINPKVIFLVVCTRLAGQILSDGTNAHKTVKNFSWWENILVENFKDYEVKHTSDEKTLSRNHAHYLLVKK